MTSEDRELFRLAILQQIARSRTMGLTLHNIVPGCRMAGFNVERDAVEDEIVRHLMPAGLVIISNTNVLSTVNGRYLCTEQGMNYLVQRGLA